MTVVAWLVAQARPGATRTLELVIGGLLAAALCVALLTWRYVRTTRPDGRGRRRH